MIKNIALLFLLFLYYSNEKEKRKENTSVLFTFVQSRVLLRASRHVEPVVAAGSAATTPLTSRYISLVGTRRDRFEEVTMGTPA